MKFPKKKFLRISKISLVDLSVDLAIVKKSGAWFTYEGEQLGQGREKAKEYLRTNPEIMMEISDKVLIASGLKEDPNAPVIVDEVEVEASEDAFTAADDQPIKLD